MSQRIYSPLEDQELRAGVIAHFIRMQGHPPAIGQWMGFSLQLKHAEAPSVAEAIAHVDQATPLEEKAWCEMTVTAEDVERGCELVRNKQFTGHPGKKSSMPWGKQGGDGQ